MAGPQDRTVTCPNCRKVMEDLGYMELRRGGATGIETMLLGGLNRLAEDLLPVQAYCCSACTKLEFYFSQ